MVLDGVVVPKLLFHISCWKVGLNLSSRIYLDRIVENIYDILSRAVCRRGDLAVIRPRECASCG